MSNSDKQKAETLHCSFCGKSQHEVEMLIAGPGVFICNDCVDVCLYVFHDEGKLDQLPELENIGETPPKEEINIEKLRLKLRFQKLSFDIKRKSCMYLCPFSESFNTIYEDHVKQAVEIIERKTGIDHIFCYCYYSPVKRSYLRVTFQEEPTSASPGFRRISFCAASIEG